MTSVKIVTEITADGKAPKTKWFFDGVDVTDNSTHYKSRVLTNTSYEEYYGIFSMGEIGFKREDGAQITVRFESRLGTPKSPEEHRIFCEEIQRRVQMVNEAFEQAYPRFRSETSFTV